MVRSRDGLSFKHCRGHAGHILNEAADAIARLAGRSRVIGESGAADLITEARHRVRARARMVRLLGDVLEGGPLSLDHADVLDLVTGISAVSWL
jgi:hypothetical protein